MGLHAGFALCREIALFSYTDSAKSCFALSLDFYDFSLVRATDAAFANVFLAPSVFQCRHTTVCVGYERCTDGKESTVSAFSLSLQRFVCMR